MLRVSLQPENPGTVVRKTATPAGLEERYPRITTARCCIFRLYTSIGTRCAPALSTTTRKFRSIVGEDQGKQCAVWKIVSSEGGTAPSSVDLQNPERSLTVSHNAGTDHAAEHPAQGSAIAPHEKFCIAKAHVEEHACVVVAPICKHGLPPQAICIGDGRPHRWVVLRTATRSSGAYSSTSRAQFQMLPSGTG